MRPDTDYRLKPGPALIRSWYVTSLLLWLISSPVYAFLIAPMIDMHRAVFAPTGLWSPVVMALPSLGLGLLIAIILHRTASVARVLRPTRARVFGAIGFWLIMPMAAVSIFPFSAGYIGITTIRQAGLGMSGDAGFATVSMILLGVSYLMACVISHGLPHIGKRIAAYALIWGGCASFVIAAGLMWVFVL